MSFGDSAYPHILKWSLEKIKMNNNYRIITIRLHFTRMFKIKATCYRPGTLFKCPLKSRKSSNVLEEHWWLLLTKIKANTVNTCLLCEILKI